MATRVVTSQINRPTGAPWKGGVVRFRPTDDTFTVAPDAHYPIAVVEAVANESGLMTVTLAAGLSVSYRVELPDGETFTINVPEGSPTTLEFLRAAYGGFPPDAPPDLETALTSALADPAIQGVIDHANLDNHGINTHTDIDVHLGTTTAHGATGAVVGTTNAQTVTNKTLGTGTKVAVGSDATGDTWYRDASGNLARRAIGSAGQVLTVSGGLPTWAAPSGGGGGAVEVREGGATVVAVATALDFNGAHFDLADAGSGVVSIASTGGGGGGGGSGSVDLTGAIKLQLGDPAASSPVISTGTKAYFDVPFGCTLTGWRLLADQSTTTTLDVWRDSYANYPPTDADRIAGTEKPALSAALKAEDTGLSTWTTAVTAGDILGVEVEANTNAKWLELTIYYTRPVVAQYTAEDAQDHVGGILADSTSIDFTYDDATPAITAAVKYGGTGGNHGSAATAARSDHAHAGVYADASHGHTPGDVTDLDVWIAGTVGVVMTDSASIDFAFDGTTYTTATVVDNSSTQKVRVSKAGALVGTRREINLIEGSNVALTVADDAGNDRVNVTVTASGGGGGGGAVDIKEGNANVVLAATAVDFDASDFNVADAGSGRATVALAYGTTAGTPAEGNHTQAASTITDFNEAAQDAVGGILADSTSVNFTYDDSVPEITAALVYAGSGANFGTAATPARSDHTHDASELANFAELTDDRVAALVQAGVGIAKSYNDAAGTLTIDVNFGTTSTTAAAGNHTHTSAGVTDFTEAAQDAVGNILGNTAGITLAYSDGAPSITATPVFAGTGSAGTIARSDHTHSPTLTGAAKFVFGDPAASSPVLATGVKAYLSMPFACTITGWRLLADASTTTTLDVWRDTYANYPPTDGDGIAGSEKPAISASNKAEDTSLSTWTTSVAAGDVLAAEIEANSAARFLELTITYSRTLTV